MLVVVIILARMPYIGSVKRRLAKEIGAEAATRLYRKTLQCAMAACAGQSAYLALTPDPLAFSRDMPYLRQGQGDLGQRMERLAKRFAPVIFIPSDSLAIHTWHIRAARRALYAHDVVIAPAEDGGYGLIGLRDSHLPLFRDIRWSSPHTLEDTIARVRHKRVFFLPEIDDIDYAKDLTRLHGR